MHQQIRVVVPISSPPNLATVLEVLERARINIVAVGGSNVEHGGEFGFAVDHAQQIAAEEALQKAHIRHRVVDVEECVVENRPGALLECVRDANQRHRPSGRFIRDIAIGIPDVNGRVMVQIFYEGPA
jgi:hypothetical protein